MNIIFHIFDDIIAIFYAFLSSLLHIFHVLKKSKRKKTGIAKTSHVQFADLWILYEDYRYLAVNEKKMQFFEIQFQDSARNPWVSLLNATDMAYVCIDIVPLALEDAINGYKKKLSYLQEQKIAALKNGITVTHFIDQQIRKVERAMEQILEKSHPYTMSVYLALPYPYTKKNLDVFSTMYHINFFPLYFQQLEAFNHFLFTQFSIVDKTRQYPIAALNPLIMTLDKEPTGVYIGHTETSKIPLFEDFFTNENFNSVIIAKSGAGKSYLTKMLIKRLLFTGVSVIVCDPEGEYMDIGKELAGVYYEENEMKAIDMYMIDRDDADYLKNMLPLVCSADELSYLQFLLESSQSLQKCINKIQEAPALLQQKVLSYLSNNTQPIKDNSLHLFHTNSENVKIAIYKIMYYAMHRIPQKTIIFIDEAHRVMDDPYVAQFIRQLAKRGRKYHIGICVISQDILDFVQNKWSKAVISNASCKFLLKQEQINLPLLHTVFGIDPSYDAWLKNAQIGEGIFMKNNTIHQVIFDDA